MIFQEIIHNDHGQLGTPRGKKIDLISIRSLVNSVSLKRLEALVILVL